jgi:hypothetical protein
VVVVVVLQRHILDRVVVELGVYLQEHLLLIREPRIQPQLAPEQLEAQLQEPKVLAVQIHL